MLRIKYDDMVNEFKRILVSRGFTEKNAVDAATVFAQNSLDGIYSHGINRFPRVVEYLDKGEINPDVVATCEMSMGAIERWEGHRGFGPLNAKQAMDRACELAKQYGIGMVEQQPLDARWKLRLAGSKPGMHRYLLVQHNAKHACMGR